MSGINGHAVAGGSIPSDGSAVSGPDVLAAELQRLESEIATEEARIEAARQRQAESNASLRQVLASMRARLAEMDHQQSQRLDAVRAAAAAEAHDVVERARRQADELLREHAAGKGQP